MANIREIARVCHEANRAWCFVTGDNSQTAWDDAPEWQQSSAIDGVWFVINTPGAGPEASHKNWSKVKLADGWKWGEAKDADAKTHPCLVPFEQLPKHQQRKDILFRAIVKALA